MSLRTRIYKKMHRDIKRQKGAVVKQIARELLTQSLKERFKLAWKIIKG
jgi:hypothetical protein